MKALIIPSLIVIFILFSFINLSFCDLLKFCQNNICKNGGTCLLMSPTPIYTKCSSKEIYYNNNCYEIIREALNRSSAADYCNRRLQNNQDGGLLSIKTSDDRRIIADMLQNNVADKSKAYLSIGFWTGGRSIGKVASNLSWYWQNTTEPMSQHFWGYNEPKTDDDLNNLCISLDSDSLFQSWSSRSCSDLNFFVCERTASDMGEEQNLLTQCKCPPAYTGKYCEIEAKIGTNETQKFKEESENIACENDNFIFSCPNGGVILVDYALFGFSRISKSEQCSKGNGIIESKDFTCIDSSSLQTIIQKCQGLTYCQFSSVGELFSQRPCPRDIPVALNTRLRCSGETNIPNKCPNGALYIQGRCYKPFLEPIISSRKTYDEAQAECGITGGNLANPQREPIFSMLYSEIEKSAEKLNLSLSNERFWVRNETESLPSTSFWKNMCPFLEIDTNVPQPGACQSRLHWICEYPPSGELTQRITESLTLSSTASSSSTTTTSTTSTTIIPACSTCSKTTVSSGTTIDTLELEGQSNLACPEITTEGVKFPRTPACQDAVVACPDSDELIGHIRFTCSCEHGTWMNKPDYSNCSHKWLGEVSNRISNNENSVNIVETVFVNLRTNIAEQKLYGGDIIGIIDAGEQLVPLARSQLSLMSDVLGKVTFAQNFTTLMGHSGDQLLSDAAEDAWGQLNSTQKINRASDLMTVLEKSMVLVSENKAEFQQRFSNWICRTETKIQPANDMMFSPMSRMMSASAVPEAPKIVEFDGFANAPMMELPGLDTLSSLSAASAPMASMADQPNSNSRAFHFPTTTDSTKFGYFVYKSVGKLLAPNASTIINSQITGAFINDPVQSIELSPNQPVNFTFPHIRKAQVSNPRCVYWDINDKEWSTRGCVMVETTADFTRCQCTHLTSFAILMDFNGNFDNLVGTNAIALDLITIFGCALSIVCLTIAFLIFTLFRSLYTVRHAIHRNLCLCLLVAELLFVIGIDRTGNSNACRGVAIALHYFFLASFCWMLLEGYQLYMMLIQVFEPNRNRFYLYYLIGYALPAVIVAISAGITWRNYGTPGYCWINVRTSTLWAFIIPIIVIIVANIIVLLIALRVVLSVKSRDRSTSQRVLGWLKGSATLLCLLGITWIFGFLCAIPGTNIVFAYIFAILNTLQGVFIFVLHVVFNDKVRTVLARAMRQNLCCGVDAQNSSVGGYSTRTGQTFFSKQKIMHFFKSPDQGSESRSSRNSESTEEKQNTPRMYAKFKKPNQNDEMITKISPPSEVDSQDLQIQEWHSKSLEEELTDRPSITVTPTTLMISTNNNIRERNASLPSPTLPAPPAQLLKVDSLQNRHSAPVKRKKFPLGSTEEQRSGELRGSESSEPKCPNIIVEKL